MLSTRAAGRLHTPRFVHKSRASHVIVRAVVNKIEYHDFERNRALNRLRQQGGYIDTRTHQRRFHQPRVSNRMRIEREQTLRELIKALAFRANFDDDADHFLEVKASVQTLANDISQLHEYEPDGQHRHGRRTYEPVRHALYELEAAGLIIVQRSYNKEKKRNHATRIWLTPELFAELGVKKEELVKFIKRHRQKKGMTSAERRQKLIEEQRRFERNADLNTNMKATVRKRLDVLKGFNDIVEARSEAKKLKAKLKEHKEQKHSEDTASDLAFYNNVKLPFAENKQLEEMLAQELPVAEGITRRYIKRYRELIEQHFADVAIKYNH